MRPTLENEVIFEGTLEARVAAQLLTDAGRADLLTDIVPSIDRPTIGRMEFAAALGDELKGRGDTTEYVCPPAAYVEVIKTLAKVAEPFGLDKVTLSRKRFMGQRIGEFALKVEEMIYKHLRRNVVEVGGMTIFGVTEQEVDQLKLREAFVNNYLAKQGWSADTITSEQLLEVRSQPGWKNPPQLA